jgi:hypothetical protein
MTRFGFTISTGAVALMALAGATQVFAQAPTAPLRPVAPKAAELAPLVDVAPLVDLAQLATLPQVVDLPQLADLSHLADVSTYVDVQDLKFELKDLQIKELTNLALDLKYTVKVEPFVYAMTQGPERDRDRAEDEARRQRERAADEARRAADRESNRNNRYNRCAGYSEGEQLYDCGRDALDDSRWDRAAEFFGKSAAAKGTRADAALYWKAYAQNKLGQRAEAIATIGELKSGYPKSRWLNDASALEVETRQNSSGRVTPESAADDDLKLLALQSFGNSPEAVPALEKMLAGTASPKLKDKALFMLAQNDNPQARAVVGKIAKGASNPDLQMRALRYLGMFRTAESRQMLDEVYRGSTDADVKRQILKSYMTSNDRERLLAAARGETNQDLRLEAVRQLSVMKAPEELASLYAQESSIEVKQQILRGMGIGGHADKLFGVAQTEKNPELRRTAIRSIGLIRQPDLASQLTGFYAKETDPDVKKAVVEALFLQQNGGPLVTLARQEKDPEMKKTIVSRLAIMRESKEARDYMLELLK